MRGRAAAQVREGRSDREVQAVSGEITQDKHRHAAVRATRKVRLTLPVEFFWCQKQSTRLTRGACASMSAYWDRPLAHSAKERTGSSCTGCEIGRAHRRGVVPDGVPAVQTPERVVAERVRQELPIVWIEAPRDVRRIFK